MYDNFHDLHRNIHPCAAMARKSSALTMNSGVVYLVIFNVEDYDPCNAYNPATGVYTCPHDGLYSVDSALLMNATNDFVCGEAIWYNLRKNAANYLSLDRVDTLNCGGTNIYPHVRGHAMMHCLIGATITITIQHTSGLAQTLYTGDSRYNYLHIERVGPYHP